MAQTKDITELFHSLGLDESTASRRSVYDLAIDFGTAFTKAAARRVWPPHESRAQNGDANFKSPLEDILIIDRYPGPHSSKHLSVEVPTTWVYSGTKLVSWGVDLDDREENEDVALALVKLLLDESERGASQKEKIKAKRGLVGLSLVDILADYLRDLLRHTARRIDNIDPNEKLIRVILCIPAIWQPLAQQNMREACQRALGTGMVLRDQKERGLVTEPEAVAAFLVERYPELNVEIGDLIGVLDCGGGTSDIALLEIVHRKPLQMSQVAPVHGAMLGSIFLDEAFEEHLRKRVSHLTNLPRFKIEAGVRKAVGQFKNELKPTFEIGNGREVSVWFDGLPNDPDHGITPNRVWFTETEFREIFDPIARGNVNLGVDLYESYKKIMEREKTPVKQIKYLFFVGGLSGSVYMEDAIRKAFWRDRILGHRVIVKTPSTEGATALVQGALLLASNVSMIKDVRIPHGYAIVNDEPWREAIHGRQIEKYIDKYDKRRMVRDRVQILVQKEDIIRDSHNNSTVETSGDLYFDWELGQPCDVEVNLWRCSERVENHADLVAIQEARAISLAYTLSFNLEDAIDARTEMYRAGGKKGVRPVSELDDADGAALPRITRSSARSQVGRVDLVLPGGSDTESVRSTPPTTSLRQLLRSTLNFHEKTDFDQSDPDTMESANGSFNSSQPANTVCNARRETFFRSTYQVVVRIVGSELTFEVEAPPGGPILQSATLSIADVGMTSQ